MKKRDKLSVRASQERRITYVLRLRVKVSVCVDILAQTLVCMGSSVRGGITGEVCVCLGRTVRKTKCWIKVLGLAFANVSVQAGNSLIPDGS